MNRGDRVKHSAHGEGEIIALSKNREYAVVKYFKGNGEHYYRTHAVITLKKADTK